MISSVLLNSKVRVATLLGTDGEGRDRYSVPRTVRARVGRKRRSVLTAEGVVKVVELSIQVRPNVLVQPGELVELPYRGWHTVTEVVQVDDLGRPHHLEAHLSETVQAPALAVPVPDEDDDEEAA